MNKQELFDALDSLGMRPGRGLGQNFLLDGNLLDFIVRAAKVSANMNILEVGPGFGALTHKMLEAGANVYSIEFDRRLADYLRRTVESDHFHLIEGDACKVNFVDELPKDEPFCSVANLPYAISSVFIARLLELANPPKSCFFMLQKEMAQRLAAGISNGNYGALSVRAQMLYDFKIVRIVPPEVFYPPPAVESALLQGVLRENRPTEEVRKLVDWLARIAFGQRRKKMTNTLGKFYGNEKIIEMLTSMGLSPDARPENLTVENYITMAKTLGKPEKM